MSSFSSMTEQMTPLPKRVALPGVNRYKLWIINNSCSEMMTTWTNV